MKCNYCGREIPADSVFCEQCGKKIEKKQSTSKQKKTILKKKRYWLIALLVVLISLVGISILHVETDYQMKMPKGFYENGSDSSFDYYHDDKGGGYRIAAGNIISGCYSLVEWFDYLSEKGMVELHRGSFVPFVMDGATVMKAKEERYGFVNEEAVIFVSDDCVGFIHLEYPLSEKSYYENTMASMITSFKRVKKITVW